MGFLPFLGALVLFSVTSGDRRDTDRIQQTLPDSCIVLIANRYFRINSSVALLTSDDYNAQDSISLKFKEQTQGDALVQQMSLSMNFSLVNLKLRTANTICYQTLEGTKAIDYFVMKGRADNISDSIRQFCCGTLVDDRTHFVIYLETTKKEAKKNVETLLEELWAQQQQNVIILVENNELQIDVYTWFPLSKSPKLKILDHCDGQKLWNNLQLFTPKLLNDLNGKVIKIGVSESPPGVCYRIGGGFAGLEVEIIDSMASALNFKPEFFSASDLMKENDESIAIRYKNYYGPGKTVLLRISSGDVHVGIGGMYLTQAQIGDVGYTQVHFRDTVDFFATNQLILSTRTEGWVAMVILQMLFVLACSSLAMNLLREKSNTENKGSDFGKTTILIWALLTDSTGPISSLSFRQVIVWTALSFFVINMNTAYKSFLASVLASPIYVEKIRTVKDMIESDLPFMTGGYFTLLSTVLSAQEYQRISNRMVMCRDPLNICLIKFVSNSHHSLTAANKQFQFLTSTLRTRAYHRLDKTLADAYFTLFTSKNFFLTRKMTTMILRSAQGGLNDFWWNKVLRNQKLCDFRGLQGLMLKQAESRGVVSERNLSRYAHILCIDSLRSPFILLGMGLLLAAVIFIIELLLEHCKCKILGSCLRCTCRRHLQYPKPGKLKHTKGLPETRSQILFRRPNQSLPLVV